MGAYEYVRPNQDADELTAIVDRLVALGIDIDSLDFIKTYNQDLQRAASVALRRARVVMTTMAAASGAEWNVNEQGPVPPRAGLRPGPGVVVDANGAVHFRNFRC